MSAIRDRPYDGRDSLDPDLLRMAASGLVPLAYVAHRLGIDHSELLARHGCLLIEERDRLRGGLLARLIDNPLTPPEAILTLRDEDWSLADRAHLRAHSRAWAAHGLLRKLLGEPQPSGRRKDRKGGQRKGSRVPAHRVTDGGTLLRVIPGHGVLAGPGERDGADALSPSRRASSLNRVGTVLSRLPGLQVWSLADVEAAGLLMAVTAGEWRDAMILSGIAADGEHGEDLRAFVHERVLERRLATFREHKSKRVRLIAGRLWLMHQEPSREPPQAP